MAIHRDAAAVEAMQAAAVLAAPTAESAAAPQVATGEPPDLRLEVRVVAARDCGEEVVPYRMRPGTAFRRLMESWCSLHCLGLERARFLADGPGGEEGRELAPTDSIASAGLLPAVPGGEVQIRAVPRVRPAVAAASAIAPASGPASGPEPSPAGTFADHHGVKRPPEPEGVGTAAEPAAFAGHSRPRRPALRRAPAMILEDSAQR